MGVQPLRHGWDVTPVLVELEVAQRLIGAVVLDQILEALRGGKVSKLSDR
jgi:hypothetical protein